MLAQHAFDFLFKSDGFLLFRRITTGNCFCLLMIYTRTCQRTLFEFQLGDRLFKRARNFKATLSVLDKSLSGKGGFPMSGRKHE